jgi:hypothetical protein
MTSLLTFWTSLDALLDDSDLDFYDVNGVRIFPCHDGQSWTTESCVVLRDGKNIRFRVHENEARQTPFAEAQRILAEIRLQAGK